MQRFRRWLILVVTVVFLVLPLVFFGAVLFLRYADEPAPVDVIVLFLGPDSAERKARALGLLRAAHADDLFVPFHRNVLRRADAETVGWILTGNGVWGSWHERNGKVRYPAHYEHTHLEILLAREFMVEKGLRSAIFVSSPYHMRRIKLISDSVFGTGDYTIRYVPSSDLLALGRRPPLRRSLEWVSSEYLKIGWYLAYSLAELFAPPEPGHDL